MRQLAVTDRRYEDLVTIPSPAMAAVFGTQCSSLRDLKISAVEVSLADASIAALAVLTRLTSLEVCHQGACIHARSLIRVRHETASWCAGLASGLLRP